MRRQYGVEAKLKRFKAFGYVVHFEVEGRAFWVRFFNRAYKIEPSHIPRGFLDLEGDKFVISASSFSKKAFDLLNRFGVRRLIVDWKVYLTPWHRHDAKSQERAKLANFISWHRDHSSCRKASRLEVHRVPERIIQGGAFYCSMCDRFFEVMPELAKAPRLAYGLTFYERRLDTAWFKARGKRRKWSIDMSLRSKISSLLDLAFKRDSKAESSTSPSGLPNVSDTPSSFGFASDPPL